MDVHHSSDEDAGAMVRMKILLGIVQKPDAVTLVSGGTSLF